MIANTLHQSLQSLLTNSRRLGGLRVPAASPGAPADPTQRTTNLSQLQTNYPSLRSMTAIPDASTDPQAALSAITKRDWERYQALYSPVEDQIIGSLQDSSIVTDARQQAANAFADRDTRTLREQRRYGLSMDPAAQAYQDNVNAMDSRLYGDSKINESRIEQKERNDGLRRALIDIGRGVAGTANSGLGDAASSQAQRNASNIAAKSAFNQQNTQMGAAAIMAAMMFI
jgi:hypothetical protein